MTYLDTMKQAMDLSLGLGSMTLAIVVIAPSLIPDESLESLLYSKRRVANYTIRAVRMLSISTVVCLFSTLLSCLFLLFSVEALYFLPPALFIFSLIMTMASMFYMFPLFMGDRSDSRNM